MSSREFGDSTTFLKPWEAIVCIVRTFIAGEKTSRTLHTFELYFFRPKTKGLAEVMKTDRVSQGTGGGNVLARPTAGRLWLTVEWTHY